MECIVACRNKSSTTITPACAGLDKKPRCTRTSFGEQSIGCCESNALTQAISGRLLAFLNMPDDVFFTRQLECDTSQFRPAAFPQMGEMCRPVHVMRVQRASVQVTQSYMHGGRLY